MERLGGLIVKLENQYGGKVKIPTAKKIYEAIHKFESDDFQKLEEHFVPSDEDIKDKERKTRRPF